MAWSLWALFPETVNIIPLSKFWMTYPMLYMQLTNWHYHNAIHLYSRCICSSVFQLCTDCVQIRLYRTFMNGLPFQNAC